MMDISKMTDQEKSVLLARAMGGKLGIVPSGLSEFIGVNLYDSANMALAWRVLNWAARRKDNLNDYSYPYTLDQELEWYFERDIDYKETEDQFWARPSEEVVMELLDLILSLALEVGIVSLDDVT